MELGELEKILKKSWSKDTSSDSDNWSFDYPAWGQCAVSSLIVQDYLMYDLVRSKAVLPDGREISHYFNKTRLNEDVDVTRSQFPKDTIFEIREKPESYETLRDYVLSNEGTKSRYFKLKKIFEKNLV